MASRRPGKEPASDAAPSRRVRSRAAQRGPPPAADVPDAGEVVVDDSGTGYVELFDDSGFGLPQRGRPGEGVQQVIPDTAVLHGLDYHPSIYLRTQAAPPEVTFLGAWY